MTLRMKYAQKALFQIYPDTIYPGYTWGETWNGWATPYFIEPVARMVMEEYYHGWTIIERDLVGKEEDGEMVAYARAYTSTGLPLYSIGGWSWIWDRVICVQCNKEREITRLLDEGAVVIEEHEYGNYFKAYCPEHAPNDGIDLKVYLKNVFGDSPFGETQDTQE